MKHTPIVLLPLLLALAHFGGAQTLIYKDDLHEAGTRFVTRDVQIVSLEEKRVFVASTCKQFAGSSANVTVLLNNNPMWLPNAGIVNFYVVDDPAKPESAALCSNIQSGQAVPYCLVPHWNSTNDIYVIATAGRVFAVTFTMTIRISPKQSKLYGTKASHLTPNTPVKDDADYYYLSEIVEISTSQKLAYQEGLLLDVTFCPNPQTTDRYTIDSTVFGTDGISSYTQYVCDVLPCTISSNVKKYNGHQLPSNTLILSTTRGEWQHVYVLVVCWGGNLDPKEGKYVGQFQYAATITASK